MLKKIDGLNKVLLKTESSFLCICILEFVSNIIMCCMYG